VEDFKTGCVEFAGERLVPTRQDLGPSAARAAIGNAAAAPPSSVMNVRRVN